jgi:4,5-dihydroxyphthalate decarboxylase
MSVLGKGDLQSEYGVPWREIKWVVAKEEVVSFNPEKGVSIKLIAKGQNIGNLLEEGEIEALIIPQTPQPVVRGSDKIRRLFSNPKQEELKYFQKNGFYPIMHVVAFKDEILKSNPWVALSVMEAFNKAKDVAMNYYDDPNWSSLAWGRHFIEEERRLLGNDPWPHGVRRNRANLERFMGYSLDQGLMEKKLTVEELFTESTLET